MTSTDDNGLMSPAEVARYLVVPLQTVYSWRHQGTGPRGAKVGKHVRYRRCDVDAWLDQRTDPPPAA